MSNLLKLYWNLLFILVVLILPIAVEKTLFSTTIPVNSSHPEVNDPPKFESVKVDFPVTEGNIPGVDTDEARACVRVPIRITFLVTDPDGDRVTITVDTDGDGKFDDFKKIIKEGKKVIFRPSFKETGPRWIKYKACDSKKLCTAVLKFKVEMVACPPKLVEFVTKTERVGVGDKVYMQLRGTDPQKDKIRYEVDWDDDGNFEQVTRYYKSSKRITLSHSFKESGSHVISARCCDKNEGCSEVKRRTVVVKPPA